MVAITYASGLASLVCFILILVKMFQNDMTGMGIACAVGILACGLGALLAFIMGWVNVEKLKAKNIMLVWTGLFVLNIIMNFVAPIKFPGMPEA